MCTKIIFYIADNPCHGTKYHTSNYPYSDLDQYLMATQTNALKKSSLMHCVRREFCLFEAVQKHFSLSKCACETAQVMVLSSLAHEFCIQTAALKILLTYLSTSVSVVCETPERSFVIDQRHLGVERRGGWPGHNRPRILVEYTHQMSIINNIFAALNNDTEMFLNKSLVMNSFNSFAIPSSCSQQEPRYQKEHPPYCQCCANHGVQNRLKGHKKCDFQSCECLKCKVVKRRRRLMADQIKERRRQRKMERDAAKAAKSSAEAMVLQTNQDTLTFTGEQPLNIADINTQLILDALQFNNVMPCLPQAPIPMVDSAVPFDGINPSNIGCSSTAASISPSNSIATTSDEFNISALALLETLRMNSFAPPPPTFSIPPPLNLCALQPGISYSSMDVPVSPTMPLPMFPPNESFTYSNSQFSLPNTFLQQIQQQFFF